MRSDKTISSGGESLGQGKYKYDSIGRHRVFEFSQYPFRSDQLGCDISQNDSNRNIIKHESKSEKKL